MARTVNEQEYAKKRREILDAAQRLVYTKGYERMTIQDILDILEISSGAFYHYFDSKPALLNAIVERIQEETEKPLLPIVRDPNLSAMEKLRGFFDTIDRLRSAHMAGVIRLGRVWYTDENALVRQKVERAVLKQRSPLLAEIVRQGIREGVFTTAYPEQSGEVILSLLQGMGNTHAELLLRPEQDRDAERCIEEIVATHTAYMDAIERVLGAPPDSLHRINAETARVWVTAALSDFPAAAGK